MKIIDFKIIYVEVNYKKNWKYLNYEQNIKINYK